MSGKQIIFYEVSEDILYVLTKLSEKLYESGEKTLILFDNETKLKEFDMKLWTYSKLSFIPHGSRHSISLDKAEMCAIWLSMEIEFVNKPTVLMHEGINDITDTMQYFEKIIDIFSSKRTFLKDKFEKYKKMGFVDQKIWIQDGRSWKEGAIS